MTGMPTYGVVRCLLVGAALSKLHESALVQDAETLAHYVQSCHE
jgi:hypothetical protein